MPKDDFAAQLGAATAEAFADLRKRIKRETLYAFALYTSGEEEFSYVCASGNTEQKLGKDAEARWSAPDWHYHDFSQRVGGLALPKGTSPRRDAAVYEAMAKALLPLRKQAKGVTWLILCGDMSDKFFRRGLERLNPKAVVKAYLRDHTPEAFLQKLDALPAKTRPGTVLGLWRDLVLERKTPLAAQARSAGATEHDIEARIAPLGARALPALLEYMEEHAFAPPFNVEGTDAWERLGSSTVEMSLATSACMVIRDIGGLSEDQIVRMQRLLAKKVAADAKVKGHVSTLAANIAFGLHELYPDRFPKATKSDTTNHLKNPKPFLPK